MIIDPTAETYPQVYRLLTGTIVPRPIAFVSTLSPDGVRNLAPFSFFNGVCSNPPILCFSTAIRRDGTQKDTYNNIVATKEFVVNIVSGEISGQMNASSADVPPDVDEFTLSGLTPVGSDLIRPPRVMESRVSMECTLLKVVDFGFHPGGASTIFGQVLRFHIRDELFDDYRIDPDKLDAIGRMGGSVYVRTTDRFSMARPR
jgi:flavin reductase (DIM6/NTAB) family NADH-FMN oxidoreductase RutF